MSHTQILKLRLVDTTVELAVKALDHLRFEIMEGQQKVDLSFDTNLRAELLMTKKDVSTSIWKGVVRFPANEPGIAKLCVTTTLEDHSEISMEWSDLPEVLDIFDGGYDPLTEESTGHLMDNLFEFTELVDSWIYWTEAGGGENRMLLKFIKPENLVNTTELMFEPSNPDALSRLPKNSVVTIQFDMFEQTWFMIGLLADRFEGNIFVTPSDHIYRASRRNGRRMPVQDEVLDGWRIIDIGDFGLRGTSSKVSSAALGEVIKVTMPTGFTLPLTVVASRSTESGLEARLWLKEDSPEIRSHWQRYVQSLYYPNLTWRTPETHSTVWDIYKNTGYLDSYLGEWVLKCKEDVEKEWNYVDDKGPHVGTMVIGWRDGAPKGTIGVSRIGGGAWLAQAAAMSNEPKDLPVTRSLYSWRTRMILMQPDGLYHVAMFEKEKKFLERFFRKFYLHEGADKSVDISWREKYIKCQWNNPSDQFPDIPTSKPTLEYKHQEPLLSILAADDGTFCKISKYEDQTIVQCRPHAHLLEVPTGFWKSGAGSGDHHCKSQSLSEHKFYGIYADPSGSYENSATDLGLAVVWICARTKLEMFTFSSSVSIQQMYNKYGKLK